MNASEPITLRPYQSVLALGAMSALDNHKRIVVACPTGSGKTVIAMHGILPHLEGKVAWVTHRRELATQARAYNRDVSVFMAQGEISGSFDVVIIDEGHHVCAAQYRKIIHQFKDSKIIALTATPYRLDGVGLGSCGFSSIVHGPDIYQLTNQGTLSPVRVFIPKSEHVKAWTPDACAVRIESTRFSKCITFCRSVSEAVQTVNILNAKGIKSASVDGTTSKAVRDSIFRKFQKGSLKVMCNHSVFTEGVDVPCVDLVVLNRHTMSRCLWKQMVGRGTRTFPGKKECVVLDLAGNGVVHGSIYDKEYYDLNGKVEATESRTEEELSRINNQETYEHNQGEELKEWKPQPKPFRLIENLQQLKLKSPLHRLRTGFLG